MNPYQKAEAETMAWSKGLKTAGDSKSGVYVTKIDNGDFLKVRSVDFGKGAKTFEASVASASKGGLIEIRLDNPDGELLGSIDVKNTGDWQNWSTVEGKVKKTSGVHDLCFVFKGDGNELFNFDWWSFSK
jgi:arabinoxylan arabinofuranohydrolase